MPRMRRKRKTVTPPETLGARIKRLREDHRLSQPEMAALLHVDHAIVSRWETDRRIPRRSHRAALAGALGVTWDALLHGESYTPPMVMIPDRRRPSLQPLREAVSKIQTIGDEALIDFVADVVSLANRWGRSKSK